MAELFKSIVCLKKEKQKQRKKKTNSQYLEVIPKYLLSSLQKTFSIVATEKKKKKNPVPISFLDFEYRYILKSSRSLN